MKKLVNIKLAVLIFAIILVFVLTFILGSIITLIGEIFRLEYKEFRKGIWKPYDALNGLIDEMV